MDKNKSSVRTGAGPLLKLGRYKIKKELGHGATSKVYLADDPFSGREVAIKVLSNEAFLDPVNGQKVKKLFMNEASLAGKLVHPHIVPVYDAGVEDDFQYLVMEYVSGGTLEKHCIADNLLPFEQVAEIVFKCGKALDFAYRQGVIHRDIKPANIMLIDGTNIKIADFGAALALNVSHTQVTSPVGSPLYMSPEQLRGDELGVQTDIYSLGVVLYQLLTGQVPFNAKNEFELINKIINEPHIPVSKIRPGIPKALEAIVDRALQKDTARRYPSWAEFSDDLARGYAHLEKASESISDTMKFNTLRTLKFFHRFSDVELWEVLRISQWWRFPAGTVLVQEGKLGRSFFILADGEARVLKQGKLLGLIKSGDCFGEMAYLNDNAAPRVATVTSAGDVTLIKVKAELLLVASDHLQLRFNKEFLKVLASRLSATNYLLSKL